jgi:hypothetical protein
MSRRSWKPGAAWIAALALLLAPSAWAVVFTVDDDGPADFTTIQQAITAASNGDEIVVAPGRYRETLSFQGKAIVVRSERGPADTVVFLEGEQRIVLLDGDSTLRGFTIRGGIARVGGGIRVTGGASARIEDNVIEDNAADQGGVGLALGGAIAVEALSQAVITRNVIRNNEARGDALGLYAYGGGIDVGDGCTATITDNVLSGNTSTDSGGAISVGVAGESTPVEIAHNTLVGNSAGQVGQAASFGGGLLIEADAVVTLRNNLFVDNSAATDGGGTYFFSNGLQGITYETNVYSGNVPNDCAGLTGPKCSGGQLFVTPLFQGPTTGDYRPRSDSPILDQGSSGGSSTVDLDGRPRVADGDHDGTATPDPGAHENQGESTRLRFTSATTLSWDDSVNASAVHDLYRDDLDLLGLGSVGTCLQPGLAGTTTDDAATPAPGAGFVYLVAARDVVAGSLGFATDGTERVPAAACP